MGDVPALLYHKITNEWEVGVTWVTPIAFERQMKALADAGWTTVLPGEKAGERVFHLIFDDGYEGIFQNGLPVLEQLGFQATVFLPGAYIGLENSWDHQLLGRRHRHLGSAMIRRLVQAGWTIGSHGMTHRALTHLTDDEARQELIQGKAVIEEITGEACPWVSFPFGRYDSKIIDLSREAGYSGAVVPTRSNAVEPDFSLIVADAVYQPATRSQALRLVGRQGALYYGGRLGRRFVNRASAGTILWKTLFQSKLQ
ncbi:MAG: polysaccharide deacetylase family protein [Calditrichaeota bacterium]|nr:polysaccharide deacetylase family protein [Calditrichota bacterium]